ncbi:hypothetical protein HK098_004075 [Nowakowskiella sp. JEL0407]|nr:hypothetical protein HK098_004075 [Nowakowskiella sp. JEL0407]
MSMLMFRFIRYSPRIAVPSLRLNLRSFSTLPTLNYSFRSAPKLKSRDEMFPEDDNVEDDIDSTEKESKSPKDSESLRFSDLPHKLSSETSLALKRIFSFESMTPVQHAVLSKLPIKQDLLVRARTGTGKTLAFLIAAIESLDPKLVTLSASNQVLRPRPGVVSLSSLTSIVVISPTRELALQIASEARNLLKYHPFNVATLVGGESKGMQINMLQRNGAHVIVATPGRMIDVVHTLPELARSLKNTSVFVLDECDSLLDMGFSKEINEIMKFLPEDRRTFMFSATLSKEIRETAHFSLARNYLTIDTVPANEVPTHAKIPQSYVISPFSQFIPSTIQTIRKHRKAVQTPKIIVFCPTTSLTNLFSSILRNITTLDFNVLEIHSKLDQKRRSKVSDIFRKAITPTILVTSDVSARGVDYPGVTLVLQLFATKHDAYIHRIGRTGRAGKSGEGVIILTPMERSMLQILKDVPITKNTEIVPASAAEEEDSKMIRQALKQALRENDSNEAAQGFLSYLMNNSRSLGISKQSIGSAVDQFSTEFLGLEEPVQLDSDVLDSYGMGSNRDRGRPRKDLYERRPNYLPPGEKPPRRKGDMSLLEKMNVLKGENWRNKIAKKVVKGAGAHWEGRGSKSGLKSQR